MVFTARIDGATTYAEIEMEGDIIKLPTKIDTDYKYAMICDDICEKKEFAMLFASKDGKNYVAALEIESNGKRYSTITLGKMLRGEK